MFEEEFTDGRKRGSRYELAVELSLVTAKKMYTKAVKSLNKFMGGGDKSVMYFYARPSATYAVIEEKQQVNKLIAQDNKTTLLVGSTGAGGRPKATADPQRGPGPTLGPVLGAHP